MVEILNNKNKLKKYYKCIYKNKKMVSSYFSINSRIINNSTKMKGIVYSILMDNLYCILYDDNRFEFEESKDIELFVYRNLTLQ